MTRQDLDSSASGYISDSFEGISQTFTDVEILSTSEVNVVAKAKRYGRWWLLKGLRKEVAAEAGYQQRLRKELEILMQLQHPGVVTVIDLEDIETIGKCIVMEYVEGITLKDWLKDVHDKKQKRYVAMQLAEAVKYIHSKGVVHRDLKPQNIMIALNGKSVKLIDFGLADSDSHATLKQPAGTLNYMSPEQAATTVADVRNDIYSLGIIFNQMELGISYRSIIKRCLRPIDERYQNMDALMYDMCNAPLRVKRLLMSAVAALFVVAAILIFSQRQELQKVYSLIADNEQQQAELKITIGQLNDSLERVALMHHKLKDEQQKQIAERKRIDNAIENGKVIIDNFFKHTGIKQHLDTLSDFRYFREDIFRNINKGAIARNSYLDKIHKDFTENEFAEITNALIIYQGNIEIGLSKQYDKLKEKYDRSFTQGN